MFHEYSKAHIPPVITFTLATKLEEKVCKQIEIDVPNENPNVNISQGNHISLVWLGLTLGWLGPALGWLGLTLGPGGFLETNMLVWVMQNGCVRGLNQREAQA